jgi:hypothetical protein
MANDNTAAMTTVSASAMRAGTTAREGFDGMEISVQAETSAMVLAAQSRAIIEARTLMALKRPRDWDEARSKLLRECKRPGFAKSARYSIPRGGKAVEGWTIRFAEAAIRCASNIDISTTVVFEDDRKRILRIVVADLEANVPYTSEIVIEKNVERSSVRDGQEVLSQRLNSYGKRVFIVPATEDELLNKINALTSKAIRTLGLRLIPGDILDDCKDAVVAVQRNEHAADPDGERKKLFDAFGELGIQPPDLKEWLGHEGLKLTASEYMELRAVYGAIRDGEARWSEILAGKLASHGPAAGPDGKADPAPAVNDATAKARAVVEARMEATRAKSAPKANPAPAQAAPPPVASASADAPKPAPVAAPVADAVMLPEWSEDPAALALELEMFLEQATQAQAQALRKSLPAGWMLIGDATRKSLRAEIEAVATRATAADQ